MISFTQFFLGKEGISRWPRKMHSHPSTCLGENEPNKMEIKKKNILCIDLCLCPVRHNKQGLAAL